LADALALMQKEHSSYVLVTENRRALGILTERDVPRLMVTHQVQDFATLTLAELAISPVQTVRVFAWLSEAAHTMQQLSLRHLAVVDAKDRLVGMLQAHDLMVALGQQLLKNQAQVERRNLRSRTRMAEERLNLAANAASMGFWDFDVAADRITFSEHMLNLMGGKGQLPDYLDIEGFLSKIHRDQQETVRTRLRETFSPKSDSLLDVEYQVRGLDAQWRWVQTRGRVVQRGAEGRPLRIVGVTMDIEQRKHQEAELARAMADSVQRQHDMEQLSRTINRSPVVAMTWAMEGGWPIIFASENVSLWGYTAENLVASQRDYETLIHPDDLPRVNAEVIDHFAHHRDSYDQSYRLRAADGRWIWLEDHTWLERGRDGGIHRVHGVLTDVSVRKSLEENAAIERDVLEALARGAVLPQLLNLLVTSYEALMPGAICSVLLLNPTSHTLHNGAAPHLPEAYRQAIEGVHIGPGVGSCGTAAYTEQTVVVTDIANDPLWADYKDLAKENDLAACWSVPILGQQRRVLGTFAVYYRQVRAPMPHELSVVERGAHLASLAIERDLNQKTLRQLSLAVEQSPNSIIITNLQAEIEYANEAFFRITGYVPQEVLGGNPRMLQSGKTSPEVYLDMWQQLNAGEPWKGEFINRRKDGTEYVETVHISPVHQPDGQVTHYLAIKEDITRQKQADQQIHQLAYFDALTGLPNRQLLTDRFQQAASMAERQKGPLALMFIDLDHFKNINDTLGHRAGDDLLIQSARRLEALLRADDTLSRQGGDEFVLVLPGCGAKQAALVAEKLIEASAGTLQIDGHDIVVTLSVGIAIYPNDGTDFDTLSKCADVAMYRAKDEGRNTFRFFTPEMQLRSSRTMTLENHLRLALERKELMLVYQPQVSLAEGRLVGVEALLRWQHPTLGLVSPAEFIPLAESSGLILPIGEWVLCTAARQLKAWMDDGLGTMTMAVNLSAVQFRDPGLAGMVAKVLRDVEIPPGCLELELTESVAMNDPLGAVVAMDEISALGVAMSIDDFGTGYSSLSYLKRFKVGKLKIDQSFVRDITTDPDDKAIASAIIGLASSLGLHTIAEGVETPGQLAWLRLQGCDEAQGYFFSPPLPASELVAWMKKQPGLTG
jgi:diguanylate cyclase (GGDEF)-like protein/PAS domain S-box-containing protein